MGSLKDVVAILDTEFFHHGSFKTIREIGMANYPLTKVENYHVRPEMLPLDNPKAKKTFNYVKYNIHGLSFFPGKFQPSIKQSDVAEVIKKFYRAEKKNENSSIAYKGGTYEKNLLQELEIPSVDLELFSCPPARKSVIIENYRAFACGFHNFCRQGYLHCPSIETAFYSEWLKKFLN